MQKMFYRNQKWTFNSSYEGSIIPAEQSWASVHLPAGPGPRAPEETDEKSEDDLY